MALHPEFVMHTFDADARVLLGSGMGGGVYQLTVLANGASGAASLGTGTLKLVRSLEYPPDANDDDQWEDVQPALDALAIGFTYDVSLAFPGIAIELVDAADPDVKIVWARLR